MTSIKHWHYQIIQNNKMSRAVWIHNFFFSTQIPTYLVHAGYCGLISMFKVLDNSKFNVVPTHQYSSDHKSLVSHGICHSSFISFLLHPWECQHVQTVPGANIHLKSKKNIPENDMIENLPNLPSAAPSGPLKIEFWGQRCQILLVRSDLQTQPSGNIAYI